MVFNWGGENQKRSLVGDPPLGYRPRRQQQATRKNLRQPIQPLFFVHNVL